MDPCFALLRGNILAFDKVALMLIELARRFESELYDASRLSFRALGYYSWSKTSVFVGSVPGQTGFVGFTGL